MVVLDTNTASHYFRGDATVARHLHELPPSRAVIPAIVEYELRHGLCHLPTRAAKPRLNVLELFLQPLRILAFNSACARHAAIIRAELEAAGTPIGPHDILIAGTALRHGATLITRHTREFKRMRGLVLESWHDD